MTIKLVPWFQEMIDTLWENRQILKKSENQDDTAPDYPDYERLPKKLLNRLSSDTLDLLEIEQDNLLSKKTKSDFTKAVVELLLREFAIIS